MIGERENQRERTQERERRALPPLCSRTWGLLSRWPPPGLPPARRPRGGRRPTQWVRERSKRGWCWVVMEVGLVLKVVELMFMVVILGGGLVIW